MINKLNVICLRHGYHSMVKFARVRMFDTFVEVLTYPEDRKLCMYWVDAMTFK